MTKKIFVVPAEGVKVRKPDGVHLRKEGESVVDAAYWRRRAKDGTIEIQDAKKQLASKPKAAQKTAKQAEE